MAVLSRNYLESILLISSSFAAILFTLPREQKEEGYGVGGGGIKTTTPIPTVIFNTLPPPTFHVFVSSLIFAFSFSLSALLMLNADNNGTRSNCNYPQLHIVLVRYAGLFLVAVAFFTMTYTFVPDYLAWAVWAAAGALVLGFAYSLSFG